MKNTVEKIHNDWRNHNADNADQDKTMDFDAWLDSPEGQAWLNSEEERYKPTDDYGYSWER